MPPGLTQGRIEDNSIAFGGFPESAISHGDSTAEGLCSPSLIILDGARIVNMSPSGESEQDYRLERCLYKRTSCILHHSPPRGETHNCNDVITRVDCFSFCTRRDYSGPHLLAPNHHSCAGHPLQRGSASKDDPRHRRRTRPTSSIKLPGSNILVMSWVSLGRQ